jgi:hypothetical protein
MQPTELLARIGESIAKHTQGRNTCLEAPALNEIRLDIQTAFEDAYLESPCEHPKQYCSNGHCFLCGRKL